MVSVDIAAALLRSLFCGPPRKHKRMAVFLAASDETSGGNALSMYHFAGWIAPEPDWSFYFTPAWKERVLDGPPRIPYLHMTEIRSKAWRDQWTITEVDADERLDEAARVIDHMGSLYPLMITIDGSVFMPLYKEHRMIGVSGRGKDFQPDFLAFVAYVYAVLAYVHAKHTSAEKVDFLVENNSEITKEIHQLYKSMPTALTHIRAPELIPLLGEFLPAGKDRAPLQAADYLCWHSRRADSNTLDDVRDARRFGVIASRKGFRLIVPKSVLTGLAESFREHGLTNEQVEGIRELRQHNVRTRKRSTQRAKSRTGNGKRRKEKKREVKSKPSASDHEGDEKDEKGVVFPTLPVSSAK
jgi:hypothetical protein